MKLIADKNIPFLKGVLEPFFDVEYKQGDLISAVDAKNTDILLIRTRTQCNKDLLQGSKVKFIGTATIGTDHIDTKYCDTSGIIWRNAPGCNSGGVQQWVAAAIAHWSEVTNRNLDGLVLGIVGVGNVGSKVLNVARALGLKTLCCDSPRKRAEGLADFVDLETVLRNSDIITFHVPLNVVGGDKTYHLVNSTTLSKCKSDIFILNSSRGEVVSSNELSSFLTQNPLAQVAIDVWESEPNVPVELLKRSLIATPHIAGYSLEGKIYGTKMIVDALSEHFHLGIHPWYPSPNPLASKYNLNDVPNVNSAIKSTYSILNDDLRKIDVGFEQYRNTYNYRREFSAYIANLSLPIADKLKLLGFSV